jgi:hypothetical protein
MENICKSLVFHGHFSKETKLVISETPAHQLLEVTIEHEGYNGLERQSILLDMTQFEELTRLDIRHHFEVKGKAEEILSRPPYAPAPQPQEVAANQMAKAAFNDAVEKLEKITVKPNVPTPFSELTGIGGIDVGAEPPRGEPVPHTIPVVTCSDDDGEVGF